MESPNTQQPSTFKTRYNQNDAKGSCFLIFREENPILYSMYLNRPNRWNAFCEWPGVFMCAHEHEIYLLSSNNISSCWLVVITQIKELNPLTGSRSENDRHHLIVEILNELIGVYDSLKNKYLENQTPESRPYWESFLLKIKTLMFTKNTCTLYQFKVQTTSCDMDHRRVNEYFVELCKKVVKKKKWGGGARGNFGVSIWPVKTSLVWIRHAFCFLNSPCGMYSLFNQ